MDKYNYLLAKISRLYHILKGASETQEEWKTRLIYSICGMMAYACLWDDVDETISITHLKRRIRNILLNYKSMYPEVCDYFPDKTEELEKEISELFLTAGIIYHRPNRIMPSIKHEESFGNILFQRGISLDEITFVSGIGYYKIQDDKTPINNIKAMFGLEHTKLNELWESTLSNHYWQAGLEFEQDTDTEYIRLKPPFSLGYWVKEPDKTGTTSILRTGNNVLRLYYLYRFIDGEMQVSPLPQWQVENSNYRTLACACLANNSTLPPIQYSIDGSIVHIHLGYLLPPHELSFLKLYSWPESYTTLPCDFNRILSLEVFTAIKVILTSEGYKFTEE